MQRILALKSVDWRAFASRERVLAYRDGVLLPHLRRYGWLWAGLVAAILAFNAFFTLAITVTQSLPQHVFLVVKGDLDLKRGDYFAFHWAGGGPYPAGLSMVKQVRGMAGDVVTTQSRDIYLNGEYLSTAKRFSKAGAPLALGRTGVIPPRHFYAYAPHPDSLDSRFALTGWVSLDRVAGRAIPVF